MDAGVHTDAGVDAGTDAGVDAGTDAGVDAGTDAGVDAGTDAGMDGGVDAGTDAGVDAGTDAGVDAGSDAGVPVMVPQVWYGGDAGDLDFSANGELLAVGSNGFVTILRWSGTAWVPLTTVVSSNEVFGDGFGSQVTVSHDGRTLAVAARNEASAATGINGDQLDRSAPRSGAAYIFELDGGDWTQTTYVKASNTATNDSFGWAIALSGDGATLAVSARNKLLANAPPFQQGAVFVFRRTGGGWAEDGYLVLSPSTSSRFGDAVALSYDGTVLAVGAGADGSGSSGINGDELDTSVPVSGAVHIYRRTGQGWSREAYVKARQPAPFAYFGVSVALSNDGNVLAIGGHNSSAAMLDVGSATVVRHTPTGWAIEAELLPPVPRRDFFGWSVALSGDGAALAVAALGHRPDYPGSAHLYDRLDAGWRLSASLQAPNARPDLFGYSIACAADAGVIGGATPEGTWTFRRP